MTLIEQLRKAIQEKKLQPIFKTTDFKKIGILDANHNISNYDKKNGGSQNSHNTVLLSVDINGETYYTFDEKLF
jgi:hypothetical protein